MLLFKLFANKTYESTLFLKSLFIGVFIWVFFYIFTPVKVINPLSSKVILFITLNYLALILGYFLTNRVLIKNKNLQLRSEGFIYFLTFLVLFSSIIRYFDLFYIREVSFFNTISINRHKSSQEENFSIILAILGSFRFLYFLPYLFYIVEKRKKKILLVLCLFFFLVPFLEGYLRGSRRLLFEPIAIFIIISIIYNYPIFKKKIFFIFLFGGVFLIFISNTILKDRIQKDNEKEFLEKIYASPYNKFLPIKSNTKDFLINCEIPWLSIPIFNFVHVGQYIVHGVYEFDFLQKTNPSKRNGMYNGFIIIKLLNKLSITNIPLTSLMNPTGRLTYITFFGGMYLDFGWLSLVIMFFFGGAQNLIFNYSAFNNYFKPLLVIFVFCNIFLLIFNFYRAEFLLFILVYLSLSFLFFFKLNFNNK